MSRFLRKIYQNGPLSALENDTFYFYFYVWRSRPHVLLQLVYGVPSAEADSLSNG